MEEADEVGASVVVHPVVAVVDAEAVVVEALVAEEEVALVAEGAADEVAVVAVVGEVDAAVDEVARLEAELARSLLKSRGILASSSPRGRKTRMSPRTSYLVSACTVRSAWCLT